MFTGSAKELTSSCVGSPKNLRASVRHTDAPSGLPRVLSWLGRLSCRNTGSQLNGRHPRPVNAYIVLAPGNDT